MAGSKYPTVDATITASGIIDRSVPHAENSIDITANAEPGMGGAAIATTVATKAIFITVLISIGPELVSLLSD